MTETTKPVVTQADRDAAADFVRSWDDIDDDFPSHTDSLWLREGKGDVEPLVQAFAKHRLAHSPSEPSVVSQDLVPVATVIADAFSAAGIPIAVVEDRFVISQSYETMETIEFGPVAAAILSLIEAAQIAARNEALEEAAKACEAQQQVFLSEQYATGQPFSSISERIACGVCAREIRALRTGKDDT